MSTLQDKIARALCEEKAKTLVYDKTIEEVTGLAPATLTKMKAGASLTIDNLQAVAIAFGFEHVGAFLTRAIEGKPESPSNPPVVLLEREKMRQRLISEEE